jgi:DNA-binding transcriptional ArsR family regulator
MVYGQHLCVGYMSRNMKTKTAILRILSDRSRTLTDISRELELAPSTVSQHLVELKSVGAIKQVENPYIKKWKYYTVSTNFSPSKIQF